jgi:hypothetical protein
MVFLSVQFVFPEARENSFSVGYILGNDDDVLSVVFDGNVKPKYTSADDL